MRQNCYRNTAKVSSRHCTGAMKVRRNYEDTPKLLRRVPGTPQILAKEFNDKIPQRYCKNITQALGTKGPRLRSVAYFWHMMKISGVASAQPLTYWYHPLRLRQFQRRSHQHQRQKALHTFGDFGQIHWMTRIDYEPTREMFSCSVGHLLVLLVVF